PRVEPEPEAEPEPEPAPMTAEQRPEPLGSAAETPSNPPEPEAAPETPGSEAAEASAPSEPEVAADPEPAPAPTLLATPSQAMPAPAPPPPPETAFPGGLALGTVALLAALGGLGFALWRMRSPQPELMLRPRARPTPMGVEAISVDELRGAADATSVLEQRLDDEVRARLALEERLAQA